MTLTDKQKQILAEHCSKCWGGYDYVIGVTVELNEKDKQITTRVVADRALNDEEWSFIQYEAIQGFMFACDADAAICNYADTMDIVIDDELPPPGNLGWVYQKASAVA